MAIDTENKRRSLSGYTGVILAPVPDTSIDPPDRVQLTGLYAAVVGPPPVTDAHPPRRHGGGWWRWRERLRSVRIDRT